MDYQKWTEECKILKINSTQQRFSELDVIHVPSQKKATLYQFRLDSKQNYEVVLNDFYIIIDTLKSADSMGFLRVLSCGEEASGLFYLAIEKELKFRNLEDINKKNLLTNELEEKFRIWLSLVDAISELHSNYFFHGDLQPSEILLNIENGVVEFKLPTFMIWRLKEVFMIQNNFENHFLPKSTLAKQYRKINDDCYVLGAILFWIVLPKNKIPVSETELRQYEKQFNGDLFMILLGLLTEQDITPLTVIKEMGLSFLSKQMDDISWTINWEDCLSELKDLSFEERIEKQNVFLQDVKDECYLYTRFESNTKRTFMSAIGLHCEWTFIVRNNTDLIIFNVKQMNPYEREKSKERCVRFGGNWVFASNSNENSANWLKVVKSASIANRQKSKRKIITRETFDKWEDVLRIQLTKLEEDENRFAYGGWETVEDGSQLRVKLLSDKPLTLPFVPGSEIIFINDKYEQIAGTYIRQEDCHVYLGIPKDSCISTLPDLGDLCKNFTLEKGLLRKQRRILNKFRYAEKVDLNIMASLVFPENVISVNSKVVYTFQEKINDDQIIALEGALGTGSVYLLQGPPGTGKTTWITELILQIFSRNPMARVLLSSQSNVAIDHALLKTLNIFKEHESSFHDIPQVVRIGNDKINANLKSWTFDNAVNEWVEKMGDSIDNKIWSVIEKVADSSKYNRLMAWYEDWKKALMREEEVKPMFLSQTPILVGATCMGSYLLYNWEQNFDWVIVDEAGRATPPEILVPTVAGRKVVYVGDHKQLPPVIDQFILSESKDILERENLRVSLFEDLFNKIDSSAKSTLKLQYRMHPAIRSLVSQLFYFETPLEDGRKPHNEPLVNPFKPLNWVCTDGINKAIELEEGTSFYNEGEITIIQNILIDMEKLYATQGTVKTIAIITGYLSQRNKIRDMSYSLKLEHLSIEIDTVDAFQGKESDIVFYSLVRNNPERKMGFLRDERRMNVMMSRAKENILIIGSTSMVQSLPNDHVVRRIYEEINKSPEGVVHEWGGSTYEFTRACPS